MIRASGLLGGGLRASKSASGDEGHLGSAEEAFVSPVGSVKVRKHPGLPASPAGEPTSSRQKVSGPRSWGNAFLAPVERDLSCSM